MNIKDFVIIHLPTGGHVYKLHAVKDLSFHYSQPLCLYYPPTLENKEPESVVLYLHGHRGICESPTATPEEMMRTFDLFSAMDKNAPNSVLIFPQSRGHCDNFEDELVPQIGAFKTWLGSLGKLPCTFAGHSGAYRAMGSILNLSPAFDKDLKSVILLDAMYTSSPGAIAKWKHAAEINPHFKISSVYRKGGGTEAGSRALAQAIGHERVNVIESTEPEHCRVPNTYFGPLVRQK